MKIKKILAAIAAGAVAVSMMAINAFASTVTLNSDYTGAWSQSAFIPKSELTAIGGDVKVTLHITPKAPVIGTINSLFAPMDANWTRLSDQLTSDTAVVKEDGMIVVNGTVAEDTVSFVVPAATIEALTDDGLSFQLNDIIITSADLEAGAPEAAMRTVNEDQSGLMIQKGMTYEEATAPAPAETTAVAEEAAPADDAAEADVTDEDADDAAPVAEAETEEAAPAAAEEAAPAETTAPAADTAATTAAATGNVAVASIAAVMAVAGVAVIASRKRK